MDSKKHNHIRTVEEYIMQQLYTERPVGIRQFLCDPKFLGKMTENGKVVRKVWMDTLEELMTEDGKYVVVFTGSIGVGKSRIAIYAMCYIMYRLMCMRDVHHYFNIGKGKKLAIIFFNLTKTLAASSAYQELHKHLLSSEWFLKRGVPKGIDGKATCQWLDIPLFEYKQASPLSQGFGFVGSDAILAMMDEIDSKTDTGKLKEKILKAYEETLNRFVSRFVYNGQTVGKFFLVSSKQDQYSFLDPFIAQMRSSPRVYIKEVNQWQAMPEKFSGQFFYINLGNAFVPPKILNNDEEIKKAISSGFKIQECPVEFREEAMRDIIGCLRNLCGVSVSQSAINRLFVNEKSLIDCYDPTKQDPITRVTIMTGLSDAKNFTDYIDFSKIRIPKNVPRFIHLDMAFAGGGDCYGLAMSALSGVRTQNIQQPDGTFQSRKVSVVETDFGMRFKAPPNDKIKLAKVRQLIIDLKKTYGFNIVLVTADLKLLSEDTVQILNDAGIPCKHSSMDIDVKNYLTFRDLVLDKRWVCHQNPYIHFEAKNLIYNTEKQKVDHPDKVTELAFENGSPKEMVMFGSKDVIDAVAGSVISALQSGVGAPDIEQVQQMIDRLQTNAAVTPEGVVDPYWFLDKKPSKEDKKNDSQAPKNFIDLLKRAGM